MIFEELHYIFGRPGELITAAGNYITSAALSGIFMPCVCVMHCRRRFFFGKNDVPEICMPCNSPVEVFLRAAGAFSPS